MDYDFSPPANRDRKYLILPLTLRAGPSGIFSKSANSWGEKKIRNTRERKKSFHFPFKTREKERNQFMIICSISCLSI